ncbi:MAG: helix-turn-helix domain-containing protein [Actinomycetota bacterium]
MDSGRVLRQARRRAGLTQRELAEKAGVPQSQVARIESGAVVPGVDTLDRLLEICGEGLESLPRLGIGLDRTGHWELLRASPRTRLEAAAGAARNLARLRERAGR